MQKVVTYYSFEQAEKGMNWCIKNGWRVHTCMMGMRSAGYSSAEKVLVVYERDD